MIQRTSAAVARHADTSATREPGLSRDDELALVIATDAGDRGACQKLVRAFLPAIAGMTRRFDGCGVPREELIHDGVVGLLLATRRFDSRLGTPFWGYASWWVRKAMQEHIAETTRPVALSDHAVRALSRMRSSRRDLRATNGVEPSHTELSTATGFDRAQLDGLLAVDRRPCSLEEPLTPGDELTVGDSLADPAAESAYQEILDRAEIVEVRGLVDELDERQRAVLYDHYGLRGPSRTLAQIGSCLGVSSERVRQIEADALATLRAAATRPPVTAPAKS